jgi:hypothetical protein
MNCWAGVRRKLAALIVFVGFGILNYIAADVTIVMKERDGITRIREPVTLGVPFAKSQLLTTTPVRIVDNTEITMEAQFKTMALWADGSIKWLKCDFQADVAANSTTYYTLKTDTSITPSTELSVTETSTFITVTTGPLRFAVNKKSFNVLHEVRLDLDNNRQYTTDEIIIPEAQSIGPIVTAESANYLALLKSPENIEIEEQGPMKIVIKASGRHYNGSSSLLKYETRIYAYAGKPYIKLWHVYANGKSVDTLAYPLNPAYGASFDRYGLDFKLNLTGSKTTRFGGDNNNTVSINLNSGGTATLLQKDLTGPIEALCYRISHNNRVVSSGIQAPGWGTVNDDKWGMTVANRYFWQKYPKGLVFKDNGTVSVEQAPTAEYLYVGMGTGDEILLYFHSKSAAPQAGQRVQTLNTFPLLPRASAQQYVDSLAFYPLRSGPDPYANMSDYINKVTDNHLANRDTLGLYGNINFGDTPFDIWSVNETDLDGTEWGNNYYDCNVLTPIRLFVMKGDLRYSDIFIPGVRFFMETACWNPFNTKDWLAGYCPSYSAYHRSASHFEHHYGEGIWYYYYLTGDERAKEVGLRAAKNIMAEQWWANNNVNCRLAYQRGSACIEAYKNTRKSSYLTHAGHLLVSKILDTQDKYGLIGATTETGSVEGEQIFMMALYSDTLWKYILELPIGSIERQILSSKLAKLADFMDRYARKSPGVEEYWNFFDAPSNSSPPQPHKDDQNPDASVYWWGKGLISGTYAYAYYLTGQIKYKTLALNLLNNLWMSGEIDWGGSDMWQKASGQVMKNVLHAVAIVSETIYAKELTVVSPNGGESLYTNSTQTIAWTSTGSIGIVKIELSTDNGTSWSTIVSSTTNDGSYNWSVPNFDSNACLIRISDTESSVSDISDGAFSIVISQSGNFRLSRTKLSFAGIISGITTESQDFIIQSDSELMPWTVEDDAAWLNLSLTSGNGSQAIVVSVNIDGKSVGSYVGEITVYAPSFVDSPQIVKVNLTVYGKNQSAKPFGTFETPVDGATVFSSVPVTGWILDDIGVESVKIYNGNNYVGNSLLVEGARPDVEEAYPDYPLNDQAGWGYMLLTNFLPNGGNGKYTLIVKAEDLEGHEVTLGTKTITVDNANAGKPFGAIDTPAQGGTTSGKDLVNWGWVLTPMPNSIPTHGSTIDVWVDGVNLGHPVYNLYRQDIANKFPGYNNSNGAVGYFHLDTTSYTNGVHTIQWTATDDAGNTDGIGSRYFTIQNTVADTKAPEVRSQMSEIRREFPSIIVDNTPVLIKNGFYEETPGKMIEAGDNDEYRIKIRELEPLRIELKKDFSIVACYQLVGNRARKMPWGMVLGENTLNWMPGIGYLGNYRIILLVKHKNGGVFKKCFDISIEPKFEYKE